mmetsp:Transcript_25134/g.64273  ORF Transcript_25134/g.64273 Transcript_25134/m.64273 type:complete len:407 (-) Transcript_25134:109-1329(-)
MPQHERMRFALQAIEDPDPQQGLLIDDVGLCCAGSVDVLPLQWLPEGVPRAEPRPGKVVTRAACVYQLHSNAVSYLMRACPECDGCDSGQGPAVCAKCAVCGSLSVMPFMYALDEPSVVDLSRALPDVLNKEAAKNKVLPQVGFDGPFSDDVPGIGDIANMQADNLEDCSSRCLQDAKCEAFEFSPSALASSGVRNCQLNSKSLRAGMAYGDFKLFIKAGKGSASVEGAHVVYFIAEEKTQVTGGALRDFGHAFGEGPDGTGDKGFKFGWMCDGQSEANGGPLFKTMFRIEEHLAYFDKFHQCKGQAAWRIQLPAGRYVVNLFLPKGRSVKGCKVQGRLLPTNAGKEADSKAPVEDEEWTWRFSVSVAVPDVDRSGRGNLEVAGSHPDCAGIAAVQLRPVRQHCAL